MAAEITWIISGRRSGGAFRRSFGGRRNCAGESSFAHKGGQSVCLSGGMPQPMAYGVAACAIAAFLVTQWTLRRVASVPVPDPSTP